MIERAETGAVGALQARAGAIIVTGAAGGMGSAIARALAVHERPLILCDLHAAPLEALAEQLRPLTNVSVVAGDITDRAYQQRIFATLGEQTLAVFVHAAGVSPTMTEGPRLFAINFTATTQLVEAALPRMAPGGVAVLIASRSGHIVAGWPADAIVSRLMRGQLGWLSHLLFRRSMIAYPLSKRAVHARAETRWCR